MARPPAFDLELLARLGYAARGAVYCLVGGLALLAALGSGGDVGGGKNALRTLLSQPFGVALLIAIALGLSCFAAWRVAAGVADADREGDRPKALGRRAASVLSGAVNGGLAISAFDLALGFGSGGGDDQAAQDWTRWALAHAFGRWFVVAAGAGVVVAAGLQAWKAWRGEVLKRLDPPPRRRRLAAALGRAGYAARGLAFALVGLFLILAGLHGDSAEAKGLGGAMRTLEAQPNGWLFLGLVAFGLFAFGVFGFGQALWRRFDVPDLADATEAVECAARRV